MKTHLSLSRSRRPLLLTIIALLFSALSFSQSVETGSDENGNYVILTKYDSNGDIDLSYGTNGSTVHIPMNFFSAVYFPDGKVLLIGNTRDVYGGADIHWDVRLARVNADGTLDATFGTNGIVTLVRQLLAYEEVLSVNEMGGHQVLIGYVSTSIVGQNKSFELLLYDHNADRLTVLLVQGLNYSDDNSSITYKLLDYPDNKFLVATGGTIYLFNADGQPDLAFNGTGQLSLPLMPEQSTVIHEVLVYNGRIIVGALTMDPAASTFFKIYVFNSDGSPYGSFGDQGTQLVPDGATFQRMYIEGSTLFVVTLSGVQAYPLGDTSPATFTCPPNKLVGTDPGQCSAVVTDIDPIITPIGSSLPIQYTLSGATSGEGVGTASGIIFNTGSTTVTYSLKDHPSATCSFTVEVEDREAPVIPIATTHNEVLWPPNHKMVDFEISYLVSDNCGATATLSVTSNEPQSGTGGGDQPNDWEILDAHHLRLRAERSGNGQGRIYTITVTAVDAAGNTTTQQVVVRVPHDASSNDDLKVKAFPNPFSNTFNVSIESGKKGGISVKISDANGRLVESRVQVATKSIIQLGAQYKPGLYVVEITQGTLRQTLQVFKMQENSNRAINLP